jgi:hypothetical protein
MSEEKVAAEKEGFFSALVNRIAEFLKLDDKGKLEAAFKSFVSDLKNDIESIEANVVVLNATHKRDIQALDKQIQDAEIDVQNAEMCVSVEDLGVKNVDRAAFAKKYFQRIDAAEKVLEDLLDKKERMLEEFEKEIEAERIQIKLKQRRIDRIILGSKK